MFTGLFGCLVMIALGLAIGSGGAFLNDFGVAPEFGDQAGVPLGTVLIWPGFIIAGTGLTGFLVSLMWRLWGFVLAGALIGIVGAMIVIDVLMALGIVEE